MDLSVNKTVNFWQEGVGADLSFQFTNVLNHSAMSDPAAADRRITTPATFGRINGTASTARQMEFGLRIHF